MKPPLWTQGLLKKFDYNDYIVINLQILLVHWYHEIYFEMKYLSTIKLNLNYHLSEVARNYYSNWDEFILTY